ncbi:MAG: thiosulfate oxidation carrier complex protein SoxZ [Cytophagales bacterium]|nr:thiosulfate oxidation carrier complex protein SoxZ [Cytophagales bacterium]
MDNHLAIPMRLTIKGEVRLGGMVQAVLAIGHAMESGFRTLESGQRVPKNVIERITVQLADELVLLAETGIGISAHPYMVFPLFLPKDLPSKGLRVIVTWVDDKGQRGELARTLL